MAMQQMACAYCPDIESILFHKSEVTASTWLAGIETGKSVEMLSLCGLVASLRRAGCQVTFPAIFQRNPDLFYIRNVIPRHHGAQAGHDVAIFNHISLADRFFGAMTPKAVVSRPDGKEFLVFREGHPIHLINWVAAGNPEYLDRPDILIAQGSLLLHWEEDTVLYFSYEHAGGVCEGSLRLKNDINLPLISYKLTGEPIVPVNAILECSVGKGRITAEEQLSRYVGLFGKPESPITVLINGKKKACPAYDLEISINIRGGADSDLTNQLSSGLDVLARKICHSTTVT